LEVEFNFINSNDVSTSIVLLGTGEETLSEEEAGDPVTRRCTVVNPVLHEAKAINKVTHPGSEWLQRRISLLCP